MRSVRVNSIGNVVIEDHVEIGACPCIDRGTLGETRIGRGSKLDNLIQIGHNATIGQNCLIAGQAGLAGTSKLGDRVVMEDNLGCRTTWRLAMTRVIWAQAGVASNVPAKQAVGSTPAVPMRDFLERAVQLKRLPSMQRQLKELQKTVADLQKELGKG